MSKFCQQINEQMDQLKKIASSFDLPEGLELTQGNIEEWYNKFVNIDADMGDYYDVIYELLAVFEFMKKLDKLSREIQAKDIITGTGIVETITPEMSEKYLSYDIPDATLYINNKSKAYRAWLFKYLDRLVKLDEGPMNITFDGDLHLNDLNFVAPHFINIIENYAQVNGVLYLSKAQTNMIGRNILGNLQSQGRIKGWHTFG